MRLPKDVKIFHPYYKEPIRKILLDDERGIPEDIATRYKQHLMINFDVYSKLEKSNKAKTLRTPKSVKIPAYSRRALI